ncbi:hypothetical protein IscW_ISCW012866 [Ixodes scapularis]|uniref:Nonsense-mediated mRNA decay factor SMG8 n=1 Tax=Ixodes scapularis TaxID=6945 RepID=B7QCT6_IXOSC|nr:hypothetical protein IscW_ISCW012866 [Ixodes scapularis]|eukprot:XP_002413350.1 hypothetical protein IscW_ISCW012866 [Ixodes scapularis]
MHARGPAFQRYAQQLREDCDAIWKAGRQMCEVLSLTGNHCVNPLHKTPENAEDESEEDSLVMPHCSQVKLISTCNCGRQQSTRDDPFILKAANYNFYLMLSAECCGVLERINFPVFEPSSAELEPCASACAPPEHFELEPRSRSRAKSLTRSQTRSDSGTRSPLSDSESDFSSESPESSDASVIEKDISTGLQVCKTNTEITFIRADLLGTGYYDSGHFDWHDDEAVFIVMWKLFTLDSNCIDSQRNTSFIDSRSSDIGDSEKSISLSEARTQHTEDPDDDANRRHNCTCVIQSLSGDGLQFTVKVFIGVEYECPRGHRFMCAAPDRMLRSTSTGLVKDNANKIANSHMPLYFPCPCRSVKPQVAQLMRIHVVTPKAPVHVTLQPKVQPAPHPAPTFFPGNKEPVRLSQSAYWVLRLPFVYESDAGPFLPPKDAVPVESARLLNGVYGIVEQAPIR